MAGSIVPAEIAGPGRQSIDSPLVFPQTTIPDKSLLVVGQPALELHHARNEDLRSTFRQPPSDLDTYFAARDPEALGPGPGRSLLPPEADPFFRAERVRGGDELDPGFAILVGLAGSGVLGGEPFGRGSAALVPHGAGSLTLGGDVEAIRCRPADPTR